MHEECTTSATTCALNWKVTDLQFIGSQNMMNVGEFASKPCVSMCKIIFQ